MAPDEPGWQLIDDFISEEGSTRTATTTRRYERMRARLTYFLDTADMADSLGAQNATLLEAEREFHEQGAFWQVFGPDELVCCLPAFLADPWIPGSVVQARTQISLTGRLLTYLSRRRLLDFSLVRCAFLEAEAAVVQARADLSVRARAAEPDEWAADVPARLRQEPGPQW
ncbi:hypothetical protein [Aeromicrobium sp.]|uniref:hypothetical protein n=1 Tax=Aeromicrobium sp. TaxID=1871063 RepID=UPI0019970A4B|nr:hypothetical protein [Aeromicrobium sp.]MBC7630611.1 hypothetical protein [Aeromicrobium sp.]